MKRRTAAFLILGLLLVLFLGKPAVRHAYQSVDEALDLGHIPLFGVMALAVLHSIRPRGHRTRHYLIAGCSTAVAGFVTELIQALLPGRLMELRDVIHNCLGIALFLAAHAVWNRKGLARTAVFGTAMVVLALAVVPVIAAGIEDARMYGDFPMMSTFERPSEVSRGLCPWRDGE